MSHASGALRSLIESSAPRRPYCALEKNQAHIRPLSTALSEPYLQLNPPGVVAWLVLDVDQSNAYDAWLDAGLPPPTFIAINPANGHAHYGYALAAPVPTTKNARRHPMRYLAAIEAAYIRAIPGADRGFTGPLGKNPLHEKWRLWEPANAPRYELTMLAEHVAELPAWVPPKREAIGLGRNCTLFDELSRWAYRSVRLYWRAGGEDRWRDAVRDQADAMNAGFPEPLHDSEVRGLARSVARWVWRNITPGGFRERQAAVGAFKGQQQRNEKLPLCLVMHEQGHSNKAIAAALDVTAPTIANWLKRGKP
ncbi:replication initiation protein [Variovorax sp. LT1P1]|uniref:replication initiation protein n=1 Tax=Variovorax sp. LT1P1 TaxID=3443730 RepID=UPI003F44C570